MALIAALEFGDNSIRRYSKRYLVADCNLVCDRSYNEFRPDSAARCERVEVSVVAPGKEDLNLFEWYASQGTQSGRIVISLSSTGKSDTLDEQVIYFEDAKCFSLSEYYDIDSSNRRILRLGIMAEMIKVDDIKFYRR